MQINMQDMYQTNQGAEGGIEGQQIPRIYSKNPGEKERGPGSLFSKDGSKGDKTAMTKDAERMRKYPGPGNYTAEKFDIRNKWGHKNQTNPPKVNENRLPGFAEAKRMANEKNKPSPGSQQVMGEDPQKKKDDKKSGGQSFSKEQATNFITEAMCTSALQQDPGKQPATGPWPGIGSTKVNDKKAEKKDEKVGKDKVNTGPGPGHYKPNETFNMVYYKAASKDKMAKSTRSGPKVDPKNQTPGAGAQEIKQSHLDFVCSQPKNSLSGISRKGL